MYSTKPVVSHSGKAVLPIRTVFFMSVFFGDSSKFPLRRYPEEVNREKKNLDLRTNNEYFHPKNTNSYFRILSREDPSSRFKDFSKAKKKQKNR